MNRVQEGKSRAAAVAALEERSSRAYFSGGQADRSVTATKSIARCRRLCLHLLPS